MRMAKGKGMFSRKRTFFEATEQPSEIIHHSMYYPLRFSLNFLWIIAAIFIIIWHTESFAETPQNSFPVSTDDIALIKAFSPIRIGFTPDRDPISFIGKDNRINGIASDYTVLLSQIIGFEYQPVTASRNDLFSKLENNELDLIADIDINESRQKELVFSKNYLSFPIVLFSLQKNPFINDLSLMNGKRIAIMDNRALIEKLQNDYPEIIIVTSDSISSGLKLVTNQKVDCYIGSLLTTGNAIYEMGITDIKVAGETPYRLNLHFAASKTNNDLVSLIDRGLDTITNKQKKGILSKWSYINYDISSDYSIIWKILLACAAFLLIVLLWNRSLSRRVTARTAELTRAYGAYKESERRMQAFFNNSFQLLGFLTPDGTIQKVNQTALDFVGCGESDVIGKLFWDSPWFAHDKNQQDLIKNAVREVAMGKTIRMETNHINTDGQLRYIDFSMHPLRDEHDHIVFLIPEGRDITDIRNTEQALEESQSELELAQSVAHIGSWFFNAQTNELKWSAETYRIFNYNDKLPINLTTFTKLVYPEDREKVKNAWRQALAGESSYEIDHRILADDKIRWIHERAEVLFDENDEPISISGTAQDITERIELEKQLRQAQKMEAIGTLAGGIAHDFNNILGAIIGYGDLLLEETKDNESLQKKTAIVLKSAYRAKDLVRQILTFSRQADQEMRPVNLKPIIMETAELLRASIPVSIEIETVFGQDISPVMADPTQIHQIVMNLGTNAYQSMKEMGGKLTLSLDLCHIDTAQAMNAMKLHVGDYALLTISDSGHGMNPWIMERLFEPYFTTKEKGEGTGLGLAVVHSIVESHNGHIEVFSRPGQGTRFEIYLPLIKTTQDESSVTSARKELPQGNETILLVDDEEAILQMCKIGLEQMGFQVHAFESPLEAIEFFNNTQDDIDIVVTDMTMPKLSGIDLARQIHSRKETLPIILCSGYFSSEEEIPELISRSLSKPFSAIQLAEEIRNVLDSR